MFFFLWLLAASWLQTEPCEPHTVHRQQESRPWGLSVGTLGTG